MQYQIASGLISSGGLILIGIALVVAMKHCIGAWKN